MGGSIETVWVGLHDIDGGTFDSRSSEGILRVTLVVGSDSVDTSDASAWDLTEIDSVFHGTTSQICNEVGPVSFLGFVFDNKRVIVRHLSAIVIILFFNR
jgi:hypothetical protein